MHIGTQQGGLTGEVGSDHIIEVPLYTQEHYDTHPPPPPLPPLSLSLSLSRLENDTKLFPLIFQYLEDKGLQGELWGRSGLLWSHAQTLIPVVLCPNIHTSSSVVRGSVNFQVNLMEWSDKDLSVTRIVIELSTRSHMW